MQCFIPKVVIFIWWAFEIPFCLTQHEGHFIFWNALPKLTSMPQMFIFKGSTYVTCTSFWESRHWFGVVFTHRGDVFSCLLNRSYSTVKSCLDMAVAELLVQACPETNLCLLKQWKFLKYYMRTESSSMFQPSLLEGFSFFIQCKNNENPTRMGKLACYYLTLENRAMGEDASFWWTEQNSRLGWLDS